jgi:hypothetical protein
LIVVVDAGVALKWFLRDAPGENHQRPALQTPGALSVTADRRYLAKAHPVGRIASLGDYQPA